MEILNRTFENLPNRVVLENAIDETKGIIVGDVGFETQLSGNFAKSKHKDIPRIVQGKASTSDKDLDNEIVMTKGLVLDYFKRYGRINWDHRQDPGCYIGAPVRTELNDNTFLLEAEIYKGIPFADAAWNDMCVLAEQDPERQYGFSIEGKIIKQEGETIHKAIIYNVSITPHPVNPNAKIDTVLKSLANLNKNGTTGYAISPESMTGLAPLRAQSLDGTHRRLLELIKFDELKTILPPSLSEWINTKLSQKEMTKADVLAILRLSGMEKQAISRVLQSLQEFTSLGWEL